MTEEISSSPNRVEAGCLITSFYGLPGILGASAFAVIGKIVGGDYAGKVLCGMKASGVRDSITFVIS
ncbi:hypothetical protein N9250_01955 [bacterium]|nr:hypothetical protein [bacterium]MDB4540431.1 hypothetical protein [bacterium]MDB4561390.1 hypothetical protein [bacterium]